MEHRSRYDRQGYGRRHAQEMRPAAIRKRAYGYTTVTDGEMRANESMRYLKSAESDLRKAIDAAQNAFEKMRTIDFQGDRSTLSNDDVRYVYGLNDWGRVYGQRVEMQVPHLADILTFIQDAIEEGRNVL